MHRDEILIILKLSFLGLVSNSWCPYVLPEQSCLYTLSLKYTKLSEKIGYTYYS